MNRITNLALVLLTGGLFAPGALAQVPSQEARVTINVAERPLELIVEFLRERSGATIAIIDGTEPDEKISTAIVDSLELADVHWRTALEIAAEKVRAIVEQRPGGVWIVTPPRRITLEAKDQPIGDAIDMIALLGKIGRASCRERV